MIKLTRHFVGRFFIGFVFVMCPCLAISREQPRELRTPTNELQEATQRFHPVQSSLGIVASQEKLASEVGAFMLRKGGNAMDAAVATAFALAVTLPQA